MTLLQISSFLKVPITKYVSVQALFNPAKIGLIKSVWLSPVPNAFGTKILFLKISCLLCVISSSLIYEILFKLYNLTLSVLFLYGS